MSFINHSTNIRRDASKRQTIVVVLSVVSVTTYAIYIQITDLQLFNICNIFKQILHFTNK